MTYPETIAYLLGLEATRGWDLKLERVRGALDALGRPQDAFPCVLIAGTNGKGTTAALMHAALSEGGRRVGLYTSPHLVRFTERIRVGADEIEEVEVVRRVEHIRACAPPEKTGLTFFEVGTLLALLTFAEEAVDVAVLEVGLGGRLDATNVVEPLCSAITSIGLDHQAYLGDRLEDIAREKAGVMRAGRATVLGARLPTEADAALIACARTVGTRIVRAREMLPLVPPVGIPGAQTRDDGAVAWALLDELASARPELAVSGDERRRAFAQVRWPGRLEWIPGSPPWILDGAHNAESMRRLCDELPSMLDGPARLLFAALDDKPWGELADLLRPHVSEVSVVPLPQRRAVAPETLARAFEPGLPTHIGRDALDEAERLGALDPRTPILATGSLFLVGELYAGLLARSGGRSIFDPAVAGARS